MKLGPIVQQSPFKRATCAFHGECALTRHRWLPVHHSLPKDMPCRAHLEHGILLSLWSGHIAREACVCTDGQLASAAAQMLANALRRRRTEWALMGWATSEAGRSATVVALVRAQWDDVALDCGTLWRTVVTLVRGNGTILRRSEQGVQGGQKHVHFGTRCPRWPEARALTFRAAPKRIWRAARTSRLSPSASAQKNAVHGAPCVAFGLVGAPRGVRVVAVVNGVAKHAWGVVDCGVSQ